MPVGISATVSICSSSTFLMFTAFQRLVDFGDCPAPVSRLSFDSACELVCGRASLQQVWARANATLVSVWSQGKRLMRIRSSRLSDRRKTGARELLRSPKWNQQEERGVRGILWSSCLRLEGRKKLNEGSKSHSWWSDFEKHDCRWHFSGGKLDNEPFKNVLRCLLIERSLACWKNVLNTTTASV